MALTLEWQHRIDNWRNELRRHFYRPLGALHTDMLENAQGQLPLSDGKISLDFRSFEVKTVRLRLA